MTFQQATRSLNLATPLGEDALQLTGFQGEEELSRLFQFRLELFSSDSKVAAEDIIGVNVTFSVDYDDGSRRFFNGFVQRFVAGDEDVKGVRAYRAEVVPWLWFLTQTTDCRIFQEMTVVEIIAKIFTDLGFSDFETSQVAGTHPKREYCVQYRESDFEFVSRLMEEEGIFYFFKHDDGKHTMVLADQPSAYANCKESTIDFPRDSNEHRSITSHIYSWEHVYQFRTGAWAHTDYNFKMPSNRLMTTEKTVMKFKEVKKFERFDYPGEYGDKGVGAPLARIRMEELEIEHNLVSGSSGCKSMSPGHRFTVGRHRAKTEEGKSFVVKKIHHQARESTYETGLSNGMDYGNHFECFPAAATFRPARQTPKPVMRGCQTAVVTGPPGEEIYPDEFGRVKVQFHWDREGQYNDKSSCWIRVSQMHAGKGWGYIDLPRIGEEVIVDFLEGDPDQPIIVGRVYNGENKPPFDLPAQKTRRGNSTKTYKGSGYNEMSMDDTPGNEQIRIHGQYNLDTVVEHDETHTIHNNRTKNVDVDESMTIGNNQQLTVGSNKTVNVGVNHVETIGANQSITVGSNQSTTVGNSQFFTVGVSLTNIVGMMKNEAIGAISNEAVGATKTLTVGVAYVITVGSNMVTSVGGSSAEHVESKKSVNVGEEFSIICGASKLVMKNDGTILLEGKDILIKGSGKITAKASGDIVLKGSKIGQN
jgi:type VI secretion system secreted protein VgrG